LKRALVSPAFTQAITQETIRGGHYYSHINSPERSYPSATTLLSVIAKPAISKWREKMIFEHACSVLAEGSDYTTSEIITILKHSFEEPDRYRDNAAAAGTEMHNAVEGWVNEGLASEANAGYEACVRFLRSSGITPVRSEVRVYTDPHMHHTGVMVPGFGGTVDLVGMQGDQLVIVDWKTGALYPSQRMQVAGYAYVLSRMLSMPVSRGMIYSTKSDSMQECDLAADLAGFLAIASAWNATHVRTNIYE